MAWPIVCRPTDLGGLGVTDLRLRWEWLARVEPQRCRTTLPSRQEKCVTAMCAASLSVIVGNGASTTVLRGVACGEKEDVEGRATQQSMGA